MPADWILVKQYVWFLCPLMTLLTVGSAAEAAEVWSGSEYLPNVQKVQFHSGASDRQQMDVTTYLMKYGYLPGSDLETGALRTDEELIRAFKQFQYNANIPQTGRMDQATLDVMTRSRCGVMDVLPGHRHVGQRTYKYSHTHAHKEHHNHNQHYLGRHSVDLDDRQYKGVVSEKYDTEGAGVLPRITLSSGVRSVGADPQQYVLGPSAWQKKWLTFRILNFTPDLSYQETRDAIIRAFHLWSDVTQLTFHEVQSGHADIYIQFASGYHHDGYTFDGQGMVLAHAFFPGEGRGGDIHFDEDEKWTVRSREGVNLYSVMAHELGHSLGLAHSYVPGSLMYPWHRGYDPNLTLHEDDIMAIQQLYGVKEKRPPTHVTSPSRPHPHPTSQLITTQRATIPTTEISTLPTTTTSRRSIVTLKPLTKATVTTETVFKDADEKPDKCSAKIDAVSLIRGDVFIFSGKWFWRLSNEGVMAGYPVLISRFWFGLPKDLKNIDAAFERPGSGHIVFFSGIRYFEFYGNSLLPNYSPNGRPISDLGLPSDLEGIDAAFVWAHNRRVYLIKDTMYWKLDDAGTRVEYGYPRDMSMWSGVPLPVWAAFTHTNRHTYFFHSDNYYEFNNVRMQVRHGYPQPVASFWFGCEAMPTKSAHLSHHDAQRGYNMAAVNRPHLMMSLVVILLILINM